MLRIAKTILGIILRHPLTGTTIIPVLPDGNIVLVRRRDTGNWGIPGGLIDWGEDITTTAIRELKEETGLELVKINRLVGVYSSFERDPRMHSISILVEATVQGEFNIQDKGEITEVKSFSRDDIPFGNLSHDHDQQLQDYFQGLTRLA
jgi:8-oxo-dGTP diphosphatase